jgi:hypothetical protein
MLPTLEIFTCVFAPLAELFAILMQCQQCDMELGKMRLTLYRKKGIGMKAIARKPSNELAQPVQSVSPINSGVVSHVRVRFDSGTRKVLSKEHVRETSLRKSETG